jgi:hypothetical protein
LKRIPRKGKREELKCDKCGTKVNLNPDKLPE